MYTKAIDLREFYDSVRGRVAQRILRQHIRSLWPNTAGLRMLGLGYAVPYLKPFLGEAERVISLMPSHQGAIFWPAEDKGLVSMVNEAELPIETNSVDRLLIVHGLQGYESLDAILRESWRVLSGQGRLIILVPNRTGIWAQVDATPFGHGAPYSMGQLRQHLKDYLFVPETALRALFVPPTTSRLMLTTAPVWEKLGPKFISAFAGVNIIEASKQLYAGTMVGATSPTAALAHRRRIAQTAPMTREGES
ncbi:MAG TPA: methyltransferase domain-containing protein [Patescibacteria group bacterium]|nr:methyltransferase domain-containing protein [Patescibacteria group bacterium]